MPGSGVLCCGNLVFDVLVRPVENVAWGASMWVDSIEQALGGNGANTSYALARLGSRVRLVGTVGDDDAGSQLVAKLAAAGVDLSRLSRSGLRTPTTVVLVSASGERMMLHRPGASADAFLDPVDFSDGLAAGLSVCHVANPFAVPGLRRTAAEILRRARQAGLMTSLDTGWDSRGDLMQVLGPCLPHLDLLFTNQDEACLLAGVAEAAEAVRVFREAGARTVVLKLGADGCALFTAGGRRDFCAFQVEAVDSTGAGDCFVGGFLAALGRGCPLEEAAEFANAVGALSAARLGAVAGLLSYEQTRQWMAGTPRRR